jgi:hypothetical protein
MLLVQSLMQYSKNEAINLVICTISGAETLLMVERVANPKYNSINLIPRAIGPECALGGPGVCPPQTNNFESRVSEMAFPAYLLIIVLFLSYPNFNFFHFVKKIEKITQIKKISKKSRVNHIIKQYVLNYVE